MSQEKRVGKTLRQSYAKFWKEWIILAIGLAMIGIPGEISGWAESLAGVRIPEGVPANLIIQGVGALAALYACLFKVAHDLLANRYILSEDEVVEIYGIVEKDRRKTKLEHIRSVSVEIGVMGRILGYGDVLYFTAGSSGADVRIKNISNPEALAAEADALARRKQQGRNKAVDGDAPPLMEKMLIAVTESIGESVAVQREILAAIQAQHTETQGNMSNPRARMPDAAVPDSSSGVEGKPDFSGDRDERSAHDDSG